MQNPLGELPFEATNLWQNGDLHDGSGYYAKEMVQLYSGKYEVENQFKQMNDPEAIAFRPRYHWTDTKIEVFGLI